MSDGWTTTLISIYTYPQSAIDEIGGPGYDSGWIGSDTNQTRIVIEESWISPCALPPES
jgi:hypothetical protein